MINVYLREIGDQFGKVLLMKAKVDYIVNLINDLVVFSL